MGTEARSPIERWLKRPLCQRYYGAVFSSAPTTCEAACCREPGTIFWALGCLITGEAEVLGVWQIQAAHPPANASVFGELHERGAEFIRLGIGDLAEALLEFKRIYKTGELVESIEQSLEQVARLLPPRHRLDVLNCLRLAAEAASFEGAQLALAQFQDTELGKRYPAVVRRWDEALARFQPVYSLNRQLRGLVRSADRAAAKMREGLAQAIHRHGPFTDSANAIEFIATTLRGFELRLDRDRATARAAREVRASARSSAGSCALAVPALA